MSEQAQVPEQGSPTLDWLKVRKQGQPVMMVASMGDLKLFSGPSCHRSVGKTKKYVQGKLKRVRRVWWWYVVKRGEDILFKSGEPRRSRALEAAEVKAAEHLKEAV